MSSGERVDLTNCDREPIHIPGSIQPHGSLIACDASAAIVLRHSRNASAMLGLEGEINGRALGDLLGAKVAHDLRNALSVAVDASRPALLFDVGLPAGGRFDMAIHSFKSSVIIEFEPAGAHGRPLQLARELIGRIKNIDSVERLVKQTARLVHGSFGYDRVMIYQFQQEGAGKVVSEAKRADLESFLGQYFPASDIPQQARALYLRNTIRIISDASGARVAIEPALDGSGEPLDLSFAHLRSVSPIHLEYLRNMGVAASMSISVIVDGALWGLIACHHYSPRRMEMAERVAAEMFGEFFSLHLNALREKHKLDTANAARRSLDRFLRLASHHTDIGQLFRENLPDFAELIPSDGVGLWMNGSWHGLGSTPPAGAVPDLARFVTSVAAGGVWATHALAQKYPPGEDFVGEAAGLLAIPLSQTPRDYLFFFRKEFVRTLNWAGDPNKSYQPGPLGDRLTPRKSFAIWKETVHRQSQPWTEADREIAEATRGATVEVALRYNELMSEERARADVRQRMLNEELNHRVKNILAVIKSLVGHPIREGRTLESYVASLKGRIQALAFAHDQVIRGDGGGALVDLINAELTPYRGPASTIVLEGPKLWLDSRAFSVMALVLHELATNAAKYGALSRTGGTLSVTWRYLPNGDAEIVWRESGGPPATPPARQGFGSRLIDRSIPYDLGGRSIVDFEREGLRATFVLPARHLSSALGASSQDMAGAARTTDDASGSALGSDVTVLIVEDQMLIAMDVDSTLADHGVQKIVTTGSAAEALARLRDVEPDVAILDVNLGQGTSIPVAEELRRRGIPFLFATGYADSAMIPPEFKDVPIVRKPFETASLISTLEGIFRRN